MGKTKKEKLPAVVDRVKNTFYIYKNNVVFWNGKKLCCRHKKEKSKCVDCGGKTYGICEISGKQKLYCKCGDKECGKGICLESGKRKNRCGCGDKGCKPPKKKLCKKTGKEINRCNCGNKGCGKSLCKKTGKQRHNCKCGDKGCGKNFCKKTGIAKQVCDCGNKVCGSNLCKITKKEKRICDCGYKGCGSKYCVKTGKQRHVCKCGDEECGFGYCKNSGKLKNICKCDHEDCGKSICEHNKEPKNCKICDLPSYLAGLCRRRISLALKGDKELNTIQYLGCDKKTFMKHIESKFQEGMTWKNHGKNGWHLDHIIPIKYQNNKDIDDKEMKKRLHYTNLQPLWAKDNIKKGNRYIG